MGSKAGNIIKMIAPIALSLAVPGIGTALGLSAMGTMGLGAGLGAGVGALTGGGLKGALLGAAGGGLAGGGGSLLGSSLNKAAGLGLGTAGSTALGSGLGNAAAGALGGGVKGALVQGLSGAVGGYAQGGGFDGALDSVKSGLGFGTGGADANGITWDNPSTGGITWDNAGPDANGITWDGPATGTLQSGGNLASGGSSVNLDPTGYFSGAETALPIAGGGGSSFNTGSAAPGGSSFLNGQNATNLLSGGINAFATDNATDQLVDSQKASLEALSPFIQNGTGASNELATRLGTNGNTGDANFGDLTTSFNPDNLQNDPGYQFNLTQGTNALNNTLAAAGGLQSGNAIKAGQQFSQGLADTTYNNAFNRDLQNRQLTAGMLNSAAAPGLAAAGANADVNSNIGASQAKGTQSMANTVTSTLANLLSGSGAKTVIGYKPDGTPIYG